MICKIETDRFIMEIIESPNWKEGVPINAKIPKWLVKVKDKFIHDEYCPEDREFQLLTKTMDDIELLLLNGLIKIKERHNFANLKNPERRFIETHIDRIVKERFPS